MSKYLAWIDRVARAISTNKGKEKKSLKRYLRMKQAFEMHRG